MNKYLPAIACILAIHYTAAAQWNAGIEQYVYTHTSFPEAIVPVCHIQSADNMYAELRYNYEDAKTLSIYGGKTFSGGNKLRYDITPMAGFSTGRFTGISFAFNADSEWESFFISSQTQYSMTIKKKDSIALKKNAGSFFFSWSEFGYNFSHYFFAGLAMQYTRQTNKNDFKPGFLAGLNFKNLSFPFYAFNPFLPGSYFILGVNYEFNFKKRK